MGLASQTIDRIIVGCSTGIDDGGERGNVKNGVYSFNTAMMRYVSAMGDAESRFAGCTVNKEGRKFRWGEHRSEY